ncbi:hypothetical protein PR202_gb00097 [Eleusine coracana subsp. coracana]|uniref:Uncharacterized protein n=1 Tax=Eleusine coracana subsp. coracana TaxID=191504 RepID=A0AAV5DSV1_ELECO|nr:hypothetical protein PR202_gb00097 [Eleusine coracana subsp. coracana]
MEPRRREGVPGAVPRSVPLHRGHRGGGSSTDPAGSPRGGKAGARRNLSAAMDVDVGPSAPAAAAEDDVADKEFKKFTMEFLSNYCR